MTSALSRTHASTREGANSTQRSGASRDIASSTSMIVTDPRNFGEARTLTSASETKHRSGFNSTRLCLTQRGKGQRSLQFELSSKMLLTARLSPRGGEEPLLRPQGIYNQRKILRLSLGTHGVERSMCFYNHRGFTTVVIRV